MDELHTYTVVVAGSSDELVKRVIELVESGWEVQGGVAISPGTQFSQARYCQAMVGPGPTIR